MNQKSEESTENKPTKLELLKAIEVLSNQYKNGYVPQKKILDKFPNYNSTDIIYRLLEMTGKERDVLEYGTGLNDGYKITGYSGHAPDAETQIWIEEFRLKTNHE